MKYSTVGNYETDCMITVYKNKQYKGISRSEERLNNQHLLFINIKVLFNNIKGNILDIKKAILEISDIIYLVF